MSFGPVGAAIGAGVGLLSSAAGSIFGNRKLETKPKSLIKIYRKQKHIEI